MIVRDTPLGRPILGTVASINTITREQIFEHYRARYTPPHLVVSAAGNLDHDAVVAASRRRSARCSPASPGAAPGAPAARRGRALGRLRPAAGSGVKLVSRPIEQANLVLGCEGLSRTDDRRFALGVLNAALGGGMSSRLFQEVREKRGLAYSVYSFASQHADTGLWGIYAGCLPSKADEVLSICSPEVAKVIESGLTDAELERGKGQVRGGIVLGLEDPSSRMTRLGKSELVYPGLEPVEDVLAAIDAVTHDDIRAIAAEILLEAQGPRGGRSLRGRVGLLGGSLLIQSNYPACVGRGGRKVSPRADDTSAAPRSSPRANPWG